MSNTYTFANAIDAVYSRLRETDSALLPKTNVKRYINDSHMQILDERYYPFMDARINFNSTPTVTLSTALTAGDSTVVLSDSSDYPSSGTILNEDDIMTYTGNDNSTTLSGVTGVDADHDSGSKVYRLYDIENDLGVTDYGKPIYLEINQQPVEYYDGRGQFRNDKYTIIDDFLFLPNSSTSEDVVFKYEKQLSDLTNDGDTFTIPDQYITSVVEFAIYKAKIDLGFDDADRNFSEYLRIKRRMKAYYAKQTYDQYQRIKSVYQPGFDHPKLKFTDTLLATR